MRHIKLDFEDSEFEKLKELKEKSEKGSWEKFFLSLIGIEREKK